MCGVWDGWSPISPNPESAASEALGLEEVLSPLGWIWSLVHSFTWSQPLAVAIPWVPLGES